MQSNKANAVWASQTSSQTVGVNNWTQYQLSLTGSSYKFQINSTATTSTNLQYYTNREGVNITAGDSILLSTNGTSFSSGTAGVVSFVGAGATNISSTGLNTSLTGATNATLRKGPQYLSPDGLNLYVLQNQTGDTVNYNVYQYALSTAFDITTITYTGKTSFAIVDNNAYGPGFTFKTDGTILYTCTYATGGTDTLRAYALGTAWDISTASSSPIGSVTLTRPATTGGWGTGGGFGFIAFSPDGTQFIGSAAISAYVATYGVSGRFGNFAIYTLSVPWVINTCTTTTTNWTNSQQNIYDSGTQQAIGFWFTPDGRTIVTASKTDSSSTARICAIPLSGPYTLGNGTTSLTINSQTSGFLSSVANPQLQAYFSANGTSFTINQSNTSFNTRIISTGNDLYGKYNVNISSFSLGAAPTFAYNAAPTVRVDAETTAARVNLFPYQVYQASSTTSQAVIYKPTSGYVAANDTILLNGTTSVTVTSVTEGTNLGVAAVPITTAANRNYASKVLALPYSGSNYNYNFRISRDGSTMIVGMTNGPYGTGFYQFTLATPWDINTATLANKFVACTADNNAWSTNTGTVSFDVTPDGTRLILFGGYITGSSTTNTNLVIREYTMSQAWDIGTLRPTGVTWNSNTLGSSTFSANCVRFVPNGTQLVYVWNDINNAGSTFTIAYFNLGTPYLISTAPAGQGTTWTTTGQNQGEVRSVTFTPDGLNIITQGFITTSNTLGTANNMATATQTNNPQSATTRWNWPSGTMASATLRAYGGEFSPDGTKYYVTNGDGASQSAGYQNIWQMNVMVIPQTSYTCNFATQGSAPTSVVIPDRSVAQTITTTLSGGNMTFAASAVATNARGIATKITAPGNFTTVTNATLSMWRS